MSTGRASPDHIARVASLGDPKRRRLYELVATSQMPVGRDDAARSLGISRELAAFHLDRLVAGGLLETEYRRLSGRSGPGAGRPAKLYRRAPVDVEVTLPPRRYERAAALLTDALASLGAEASEALAEAASGQGRRLGAQARGEAGPRSSPKRTREALAEVLEAGGFEPDPDATDGTIRLRNCPYRALSARHRELICGMNLAWATGVVEGLGARRLDVELSPTPGACCVVFREGSGATDRT